MDWNNIASYAFGAASPIVLPCIVSGAFLVFGGWISIPEHYHLDLANVWTGVAITIGIAIVGGALAVRFIP